MPNMVPYTEFPSAATSGSDFWACSNPCTLTAHVTNATLGVVDFLFSDTDPIQGKVQATQFAGKEISYVWGFDTCSSPNGYQPQVISQVSGYGYSLYQDLTTNCPTLTTVSHTQTLTLTSDGIISLALGPQGYNGNFQSPEESAYFGNFVLQIHAIPSDSISSASTGASTSASSSGSTTAAFSGTNGTRSLSASSTQIGSQLSNVPLLTTSWVSGQTSALPGSSPGVGDMPPSGESSSSNKSAIIGGAIASGVAAVIGMAVLLLYLRRRRAQRSKRLPEEHRIVPLSHDESGAFGTSKSMELLSKQDILQAVEKNPNLLGKANAISSAPLIVSSDETQPVINDEPPRRPPTVIFSAMDLPTYDSHDNAHQGPLFGPPQRPHSAIFSSAGLPTYDSHENVNQDPFFFTNFRNQEVLDTLDDTSRIHDLLREWAEEHRDIIPYHLERRLRAGGYTPATHPNEIAQEVWLSQFAVTRFELAGLVELFERTNGMPTRRIVSSAGLVAEH